MKRCMGCMEKYEDGFDICPYCGYLENTEVEEAIHMSPGTLLGDRYIVGKVLGFGGFGVTYLGWDGKLEQKVAIKEYLPSEFSTRMPGQSRVTVFNGDKSEQFYDGLNKFVDEAKRLAKFQNESGIVKVFDSFVENDTAYIIMEFLDGETLSSYLKREGTIPEDQAVEMLMPIMESLEVVHQEGVLHRDIAPDNIFITKTGEIKLIDFGASRYATTSHSRSLTVIIKPGYSPEEQYRSTGDQGPHTDVYAMGACLYKMVTGKTPPDALERRAKFEGQNKDILENPRKINKHVSLTKENAILNAMNVRIEDRTPTMREFITELNSVLPVKRKNGRIKKIDIYGWPWWFKAIAVAAVLAICTVATLMATGVIRVDSVFADNVEVPEGMVIVPELEGLSNEKAAKKVEESNLKYMISGSVTSEYIEAGKIVLQNPVSGLFIAEGSTVEMYVSKGTGEVIVVEDGRATVPFVIGSTEETAINDLAAAGLGMPTITYEYSETVGAGLVISQNEDFGEKVEQGTVLSLVVSMGTKPIKMPNVVMTLREDAERKLKELGLKVEINVQESCDYAQNTVISQSVKEGKEVKKNDTITLTVIKSVWSEWSTTHPGDATGRVIEQKTQYSYSDRQWASQEDNNYMAGWTLDESKNQIFYVDGDYTGWSEWSTDVVTATATRKVESKQQQRYQDKHEVNGSTTPTPAGYTQTAEWWGDWIACGADVVGSATRETRMDHIYVKTQYKYTHYHGKDITAPGSHSGYTFHETAWLDSPLPQDGLSSEGNVPKYIGAGNNGCTRQHWWYNEDTNDIYNDYYYYRDKYFSYYKWSGWSKWKDEAYTASGTRNVESRTMYRYADQIPHTKYTFYKWNEFNAFSDTYVQANGDRQVRTQELYRYTTQ